MGEAKTITDLRKELAIAELKFNEKLFSLTLKENEIDDSISWLRRQLKK
ncbi:hypothetical protein [Bacillus sp. AFS040349]|nr:hypothetical protein [Bacillus sp. AFS040349]